MEVKVGGEEVRLVLHKHYLSDDDSVVQQVVKYKAFLDWVAKAQPKDGYTIQQIAIQNLDVIAKRVAGVRLELTLRGPNKDISYEYVYLSDDTNAAVLIIMKIGEVDNVVIASRQDTTTNSVALPTGVITKDGNFEGRAATFLMTKCGLDPMNARGSRPLCMTEKNAAFQMGVSGEGATRFFAYNHSRDLYAKLPVQDGSITYSAVPIDEVLAKTDDLQTLLAITLYKRGL